MPTRLGRLAAVVDKARKSGGGRNIRKWMETIGMSMIVFGFVCILLGWYGASHSPYQYQEIPYLISGGLLGVALVIGGGVLVHCAWSLRKIEEDRRNALAIVRSVDRLERILRGRWRRTAGGPTKRSTPCEPSHPGTTTTAASRRRASASGWPPRSRSPCWPCSPRPAARG